MKYEHTPRPLIEEHFHIRELIESQERRANDRGRHNEIEKQRDLNLKDINAVKDIENLDWWCKRCDKEFVSLGKKVIDRWKPIAYYVTKHECGNWAVRYITDRSLDPYWFKSKKVARDRFESHYDAIQPFESGYNMIYGKR